jgi:hypothetical protein
VSINYTKCNAKVGLFVYDNNIRYFLIRSTGAGQWDTIRMKENKAKKEVECSFCKSWKNVQGIHRHIVSCPKNKTKTKIPVKAKCKKELAIKRRGRRK